MSAAWLHRLHSDDAGRSLPAALIAMAVGVLLVVPLLSGGSTSLLATRSADQALLEHYALDAGIEYAIWKLRYDPSFRASVDAVPTVPVAVTPAMTLNGYSPAVTAMALAPSGWEAMTGAPGDVRAGGSLAYAAWSGTDYLFALGGNGADFWRYDVAADSWAALASTPSNVGDGAALAWDGGSFIYALRGSNQNTFWRYSIPGNSWTTLADTPDRVRRGGSLAFANGYVYALRGRSSTDFWRYDPSAAPPVWQALASTPDDVDRGGALIYAGANQFYALRGNRSPDFWTYNSSSNTWTSRAATPAAVDDGGALTYPGGDSIYAFAGGNTTDFWRYNILGNNWSAEAATPANVDVGGSLAYPGGEFLYALRGANNPDLWRYRANPPRYDLVAQSGGRTTYVRVEISGTTVTVLFWDVQ